MRLLSTLALAGSLVMATPALASGPAADSHGTEAAAHGDAGAHGEDGEHHEGGHHVSFLGDDDHDGTANWLDSDSEGYVVFSVGYHIFHILLLFVALFAFARKPLKAALVGRAQAIKNDLAESARLRDEAIKAQQELQVRLDNLSAEIDAMKAKASTDAAEERERLIERAKEEAQRIGQSAERTIRDEVARARNELRRDAVALAVELAEQSLKDQVNRDDQQKLARQFLDSLSNGGANANV